MKIALCSAVWGRVPLTRIWWKATDRLCYTLRSSGIDARVFVGGSESAHFQLCATSRHGQWVEAANGQLGEKWNSTARAALAWGADYIFILGSDDFFDDAMIHEYARLATADVPYAAMRTIYMYEPISERAVLFDNAKRLKPSHADSPDPSKCQIIFLGESQKNPALTTMGAGRLIHCSFFEGHDTFWSPNKSSGLDASMTATLGLPLAHIVPTETGIALDVKTAENIWSLDSLIEWYPDCELPNASILAGLPEWDDIRTLDLTTPGD